MALSLSKLRHFQATFSSSSSTLPLEDPLPSPPSFVFLASPLITEKKKHKTVSTRACLRSLSLRTAIVADMAKITVASEGVCQASDGICDTVVGVLGGGQLGRMMCQAASYMGIKVAVLDPDRNCPAGDIAHHHMVGSFRDTEALREFVKGCGVVTVEIEHVDVESLEALEKKGVDIEPKPSTIRIIQDKYMQKVFFNQHGVALCDFMNIDSMESAKKAGQTFGYPLMIKSRWLAYDGRGNAVAQNEESLVEALSCLGGLERGLYAEKWTPFVKELAIMVTRARDGSLQCYPVVETTHKDNICHTVEAPAQVSKEIVDQALCVAKKAVGALQGAGVFGVELFLLENGQVLLNEVAPRPHNSGHYTIEACYTSQYEQHIRAVLGLPLGDCAMKVPAAIMYNLLGEDEGENGFAIAQSVMRRAISVPGASVHWYGKPEIRKQRKMGHITVVGESVRQVRSKINIIMSGEHNNGVMANVSHDSQVAVEDESIYSARNSASVGIIMGSDSDLPVMKAAAEILEEFGISYELTIVSAHRTPERMMSYARDAHKRGVEVIIAGAGGAAHLPGMVAAMTPLPVIGVPVRGSSLDGLDSLLSIVQMPRGVPVATVAINNAMNAGLLAVRMLSLLDKTLQERLIVYQDSMKATVLTKAEKLEQVGWAAYLG